MSGGLFTAQLQREIGRPIDEATTSDCATATPSCSARFRKDVPPLPGAVELLKELTRQQLPWAIATSGRMRTADDELRSLGVDPEKATVVTRDMVRYAKPDPDCLSKRRGGSAPRREVPTSSATASGT